MPSLTRRSLRPRHPSNQPNDHNPLPRLGTTLRRFSSLARRFLLFLLLAGALTRAELTEEEKKQLFLKAREQMRTVGTPTPEPSATPHPKPKPAKHPPAKKKNQLPSPPRSRKRHPSAPRNQPRARLRGARRFPRNRRRGGPSLTRLTHRARPQPPRRPPSPARQPNPPKWLSPNPAIKSRAAFRFCPFIFVETLPVSYPFRPGRDRSRPRAARALAVHHCSQQRHPAG